MKLKLSLIVAVFMIIAMIPQAGAVQNPNRDAYVTAYDLARPLVSEFCKMADVDGDGYLTSSLAGEERSMIIISDPDMTIEETISACLLVLESQGLVHQPQDCGNDEYCYDMYPNEYRKQNVISAPLLAKMTLDQVDKCISADEDSDGFLKEHNDLSSQEKISCENLIETFGVTSYYVSGEIDCNDLDPELSVPDTESVCYKYYGGCIPPEAEIDRDGDSVLFCEEPFCDTNDQLWPGKEGMTDILNNGIDEDCDGVDLIDGNGLLEQVNLNQKYYFTAELAAGVNPDSLIAFYWDFGDGTGYGTDKIENSGIVGKSGAVDHTYASVSEEGFTPVFRVMDRNFVISEFKSSPIIVSSPDCSYNAGITEQCSLEQSCTGGDLYKLQEKGTICCVGGTCASS